MEMLPNSQKVKLTTWRKLESLFSFRICILNDLMSSSGWDGNDVICDLNKRRNNIETAPDMQKLCIKHYWEAAFGLSDDTTCCLVKMILIIEK